MMVPRKIDQNMYRNLFDFTVISTIDGSRTQGKFGSASKRRLEETSGDQASQLTFKPVVTEHSTKRIRIKIEFDNPTKLSVSGIANINMRVKEVSVFKSRRSMQSLSNYSFKNGIPDLVGPVPPIIVDQKLADSIKDHADTATAILNIFNSGNFLLMLILGGSMQEIWGMIRAVQMIVLSVLVDVTFPINLFIFLQVCIAFA